jgi:hypothetical protein
MHRARRVKMSYHHQNRLLAHWQPKRRPEGASLAWGSTERYQKITASAGFIACVVTSHLNDETNTFEISNKTLIRETGLGKETMTSALAELVEWGILTRTRPSKERPYRYALAITCPPECELLSIHNTPSELATLPIKQATPIPKEQETSSPREQATVSPKNRQLIDSDKQLNKKTDRYKPSVCPSCNGEEYRDKVIHQQTCPAYQRLRDWKPWQITQRDNLDKWAQWDYREKQIATFDSLRGFDERQALKGQEELAKFNQMVADQAGEQPLLPKWREWLWLRVQMYPTSKISVADLRLALKHSELGQDLDERAGWRESPHKQPHSYYNTEALAEA